MQRKCIDPPLHCHKRKQFDQILIDWEINILLNNPPVTSRRGTDSSYNSERISWHEPFGAFSRVSEQYMMTSWVNVTLGGLTD